MPKFFNAVLLVLLSAGAIILGAGLGSERLIALSQALTFPIVDTGVTRFYSNTRVIPQPQPGAPFFGQDAHYQDHPPSYTHNGDGTITDNVTGLMWEQNMGEKRSFTEAQVKAQTSRLGGYDDWRVPSIKELYSLILFTGQMEPGRNVRLFIDTDYFRQPLGNTRQGEREVDAQTWSATDYVGTTMGGDRTVFGVNFIDGRIKGYPKYNPRTRQPQKMYVRLVRGNPNYGQNRFVDHGDGTISDLATGLMWQQADSGRGMTWAAALAYSAALTLGGHDDWRLPNAKELQSVVDYSRSPQTSQSAAIDPRFHTTPIRDPNGQRQYPYFWSSTTHLDGRNPYDSAVYVAFGAAQGQMRGRLLDVHGAGAQRSDPKTGRAADYPQYFGPQGDVRYVFNAVRAVRSLP